MKKIILTLLCLLAIGSLNAANKYRYHTKWISTTSYWGSQTWRNYNYEGNSGSLVDSAVGAGGTGDLV